MFRIPGRGHSDPKVTELIFVREQRLNHFAIKAFLRFVEQQLDLFRKA